MQFVSMVPCLAIAVTYSSSKDNFAFSTRLGAGLGLKLSNTYSGVHSHYFSCASIAKERTTKQGITSMNKARAVKIDQKSVCIKYPYIQ